MEITVTVSEEMQRKLEGLAQESGLSVADCAHDMLENSVERLCADACRKPTYYEEIMAQLTNRTPEQLAEAQRRAIASLPTPRPLPPGKTLADVIYGQLPDDDPDEEIIAILKEIS